MNKENLPLFPREITRKDMKEMSIDMGVHLKHIFREIWPNENYLRFDHRIGKKADDYNIDKSEVARCWVGSDEADELKVGFFFANLYHRSAVRALGSDEPNEKERVLSLLFYASRQIGIIEGYQRFVERIEAKFKGPIRGGQAGQYVKEEVGEYLITLLDKVPDENWRSQDKIASYLSDEVEEFITSKFYGKVISNAENFIKTAFRKKGRPREAYLSEKTAREE